MSTNQKSLSESGALRQLKHNDDSEGFVFAYDKEITDRYIAQLLKAQAPSAPVDVCAQMRALCSACGGTGDVTSIVGEWLGSCDCPASAPVAPDLTPVIHWLEGGCDPLQAAKELRSYQRNLGQLEAPEIAVVAHVDASASADPVVELNVALLRSRSAVGIEKYGTTLAAAALPLRAWLDHALQESLDQANYLQAAMQTIDGAALAGETPP